MPRAYLIAAMLAVGSFSYSQYKGFSIYTASGTKVERGRTSGYVPGRSTGFIPRHK